MVFNAIFNSISVMSWQLVQLSMLSSSYFKGGYLDFSHLTELKNIYITEIDMKKQYNSSKIKNHKRAMMALYRSTG